MNYNFTKSLIKNKMVEYRSSNFYNASLASISTLSVAFLFYFSLEGVLGNAKKLYSCIL